MSKAPEPGLSADRRPKRPQRADRVRAAAAVADSEDADGLPFAQAGVTTHGDMLVINVAPGCEYFLHKQDGVSMRCTFCAYGAPTNAPCTWPEDRTGRDSADARSHARGAERRDRSDEIHHIYLVGGSLTDARKEGERFLQLARFVKQANTAAFRSPWVRCTSRRSHRAVPRRAAGAACLLQSGDVVAGAVRQDLPRQEPLRRLSALDRIARDRRALLGPRNVYTAMVAGIELEPEHGWNGRRPRASRCRRRRLCSRASSRSTRWSGRWAAASGPTFTRASAATSRR